MRLVVLVYGIVLLLATLIDWLQTPRPKEVLLERELPVRAGLSEDFERRLLLRTRAGTRLTVFEEAPRSFATTRRTFEDETAPPPGDPTGGEDAGVTDPHGELVLSRTYNSSLRGVHHLGDLRLRVRGPLGLIERTTRVSREDPVRIEPALAGLGKVLRLAASERWRDLGARRLDRRGGQNDFESLREYVVGDDVRRLDWKAYARRGKPMVRRYQVERGQELLIAIDTGRRMGATSEEGELTGWSKLDHALDAALELAAVALNRGDRVGIAAYAGGLDVYVPSARGSRHLRRLTEAVFALKPSPLESDLEGALRGIGVRSRRRGTVIVFSEVADRHSLEGQISALHFGARRHRMIFAGLDDPSLRRAANGEDPVEPAVRAAALEARGTRSEGIRRLRASGARVIDALPAEAAGPVLTAWLEARRS